jgi:hypothetical protein
LRCEGGRVGVAEHTKTRAKDVIRALDVRKNKKSNVAETCISSTLSHSVGLFARNRARSYFFAAASRRRSVRVSNAAASGGAYTQNQSSHCYFFSTVVIRLQCKSIRDCTVPIPPSTQARRAAMAKKRKAKAKVAKKKKTAKKKK